MVLVSAVRQERRLDRYSIPIANKKGDMRSPCLKPFFVGKGEEAKPFTKIEYETEERHAKIYLTNFVANPSSCSMACRNGHSKEL